MKVIVLEEYDYNDDSTTVIGVSSSVEEGYAFFAQYYGDMLKIIDIESINDSGISDIVELSDPYRYRVVMRYFNINEV